jgi:choline dehydrogenase-like flavoprotein
MVSISFIVMSITGLIAATNAARDALQDGLTLDEIKSQNIPTDYDYVIVGGGAGGMLMAMRLTEDSRIKVAVVEAGTLSKNAFTFQPGQLATSNFVDPTIPLINEIDWLDITIPIKVNESPQHYPQGKMIGGSTCRGFSAYVPPV